MSPTLTRPPGQIATAGYEDYKASARSDQTFPATLGEDEVTSDGDEIAPEEIDTARPGWTPIGHHAIVDLIERRRPAA